MPSAPDSVYTNIASNLRSSEAFTSAYNKLNLPQKQAVDAVEGPVLVIAGPGTGKTHLLTLRIANILLKTTDTSPESILVLTFTESATRTISKRLANFTGEDVARKVPVFTFHSFAEHLLKAYPESFPEFTEKRLMGEIESILVWRTVLEREEITYLRSAKKPFLYLRDLSSLEDQLTRERVSLDEYRAWIDEQEKEVMADDKYRYVRGGKHGEVGEMKPEGFKKLEQLNKAREAATLIQVFRDEKDSQGIYGYTDVLRIAVDTLQENESLRAELQERYQYVLADEHQDANNLQHALLDALAYDEYPNLFIVGDEKQAIFRFQGADGTHFSEFVEKYPRAVTVTLTENYRSDQEILDLAHTLLKGLPSSTGEHALLTAGRTPDEKAVSISARTALITAPDPLAERDQVAQQIEMAIKEGVEPHEIAIITLKNATADLFATHLRAKGIPTLRAGDVDLEGRPAVRFLLALMHAIADPGNIAALRESLLAPWWAGISLNDRTTFMRRYRDYELIDAIETSFPAVSESITMLQYDALGIPPLNVLSKILADTGARSYFLSHGDRLEDIPLVRQIIMHVTDMVARNQDITFAEVMDSFAKAREHGLASIKTSMTEREGQVTVITAHKSKGMEFKRVFVVALTAREWEKGGMPQKIMTPFSNTREMEDLIRFLYVALTRAKDQLTLSYSVAGGDGKDTAPTQLLPAGLTTISPEYDPIPLFHTVTDAPKLICELTHSYLEHEGLSPSAFNEYLDSPADFFAKRVLRLREPENQAIAVGNAVHAGVAGYLRLKLKDIQEKEKGEYVFSTEEERRANAFAELNHSLSRSLLPRNAAFDQLTRHAQESLESYLGTDLLAHDPVAVEEAFSVKRVIAGKEILLKGKTDAVFKTSDGECIVDFKTTTTIKSSDKEKYERQLAFYDFLLRDNNHLTTSAKIIQVGTDDITDHEVALTDGTRKAFQKVLDEVLTELLSGKWRAGGPSEYDAILTLFT